MGQAAEKMIPMIPTEELRRRLSSEQNEIIEVVAKEFGGNEPIINRAIRLIAEENVPADDVIGVLRREAKGSEAVKKEKRIRWWTSS